MNLLAVGFNHTTTPVAMRERLAVPHDELGRSLQALVEEAKLEEAMLLSTCNRTEIYAVRKDGGGPDEVTGTLARMRGVGFDDVRPHAFARHHVDAALHIFRVAASLESIVVGEPQILGQVKEAYQAARDAGTMGSTLDRCLTMAFHGAKRVRSETMMSRGAASVASVSVDLARSIFGASAEQKVLLVGAGEMCRQAGIHLRASGAQQVTVVNRSEDRGQALAGEVRGTYVPWSGLEEAVTAADVVVSGTGAAGHVLSRDMVKAAMRARRGAPMFIVDMAVPRDVEPRVGKLSQVYLYNVDDLQGIVKDNMSARAGEVEKATRLVHEEVDAFVRWTRARTVTPILQALEVYGKDVMEREVTRALGKLGDLTDEQRGTVEALGHGLMRKLLHHPLRTVRSAGEHGRVDLIRAVEEIFPVYSLREAARKKAQTPDDDR